MAELFPPTLMWLEALDLVLECISESSLDFGKIVAVTGRIGQQHGDVYWKKGSSVILSSLNPKEREVGGSIW
ncbi:unnamed protein product [Dovyalis caffra]|uniref:Uncharacterized protein n=1 Tax=Dovyalis caffra TaxID=77055 RepID=A0AAV1SL87_9ROSI|nr:unnamed protein product [Dovyalis caffra]